MSDLVLDFETLGVDTNQCVAVSCAYTIFEWNTFNTDPGYTLDELLGKIKMDKFDVMEQKEKYGYVIEPATLEWWSQQDKDIRKCIKPDPAKDISLVQFVENLKEYVKGRKIVRVWSRGNNFDIPIIARIARDVGDNVNNIYPYWAVRDIRTYLDTKTGFTVKDLGFMPATGDAERAELQKRFRKHDPIHDVAYDILRLQLCAKEF
jgi:hypothetical protein